MKRICSHRSKFFPLRVDPTLQGLFHPGKKTGYCEIVSLCKKAWNQGGVPFKGPTQQAYAEKNFKTQHLLCLHRACTQPENLTEVYTTAPMQYLCVMHSASLRQRPTNNEVIRRDDLGLSLIRKT